jgi:hypothetical protein
MRKKFSLLALCLLWSIAQLSAQQLNHAYQNWYTYFGTAQLSKHWSIPFDFQARIRNGISDKGQILNRAGLQYMPGQKAGYQLGYAYITTYSDGADAWAPEHRIFEQFLYKHTASKFSMTHRVRFEQRWAGQKISAHHSVQSWKYGHRLRYFNRTQFPVRKEQKATPFYIALQNELFMNMWNSKINDKFIDQNRLLITPGFAVQPNLKLEAGYMNQFIQPATGDKTMNHILHLAVFHNFSL